MDELGDRERIMIITRHELDRREPKAQRELSAMIGISRSYVSLIKKGLGKLRHAFEKINIC